MDLVAERWPVLAARLESALVSSGHMELADQVGGLEIVERCSCGDDFCQSFATAPAPEGTYGPTHRNVELDPPWSGYLILDVVADRIVYVEVLYRGPLD